MGKDEYKTLIVYHESNALIIKPKRSILEESRWVEAFSLECFEVCVVGYDFYIVDLSDVTFIGIPMIQMLIDFQTFFDYRKDTLVLLKPSIVVVEMLRRFSKANDIRQEQDLQSLFPQ
jgi:arginine/ornithine N-succinyltransferase beta subunit